MLSILLLIILSLCNAQWPLQSIGFEDVKSIPKPDQPGYPYDSPQWVENIRDPNLKLSDTFDQWADIPQRVRISDTSNFKLPEIDYEKTKTLLNIDNPGNAENDNWNTKSDLKALGSSIPLNNSIPDILSIIPSNINESGDNPIRDKVTNLVNQKSTLRNDTDQYLDQLNLLYLNLAFSEDDNKVRVENTYKYGMSLILRFLLEFYRIFRKLTTQSRYALRGTNIDVYGLSYDKAVDVMKEKKDYSPLQISAPVRRSADIFKSILYESVNIVQTQCSILDPNWECIIVYLANLIGESINCSNVWYHALVHMLAMETKVGLPESFIYKIANLEEFKELTYFGNIFEFIIEKIQEYREVGRVQLSAEAVFFTMLADLQDNGFLNCMSIDYLYN